MDCIKHYTRVSTLLSFLYNFSGINSKVLEAKRIVGTNTHKFIEEHLKNKNPKIAPTDDYFPYVQAFLKFYQEQPLHNILCLEERFFCDYYRITGMVDCIYKNEKGENILLDWKTSYRVNKQAVSLQMLLYKMLVENYGIKIDKCVIVQLKKNSEYERLAIDIEGADYLAHAYAVLSKRILRISSSSS